MFRDVSPALGGDVSVQPCLLALCGSVTARGAGAELAASGLRNLGLHSLPSDSPAGSVACPVEHSKPQPSLKA